MQKLTRYQALVDDYTAFIEASAKPLPRVVWANPLKRSVQEIEADIMQLCPQAKRLGWTSNGWRLPSDSQPGRWLLHLIGEVYVQEEASILAADLVGAQPGERVLDMCAAPGGKTVRMAIGMKDQGQLLANEKKHGRIGGLRWNLNRLGITCVTVNHDDGLRLKRPLKPFDRILVDAPCTCEGTSRKAQARSQLITEKERDTVAQVQVALLRKALDMVKPGGFVVYSTCTYAPEENEGVLDRISTEQAIIDPIHVPPPLKTEAGTTQWGSHRYRDDVCNAIRLWPHHNDTGGFFIAKLRRI
ncbi:MAG: RsmB/NOP family class I SAM-dependent RNA methyltransferase [Myxococcota bacterium]|nr:RsmB/NOP family class I SAM-dependent RNA methyltransferase [Myxococcota bacterium]